MSRGRWKLKIGRAPLRCAPLWLFLSTPVLAAAPEVPSAEQVSHEWLTWTAPPECPNRSELLALLDTALGRPLDAQPEFSSEISVTSVEGGFFVRMRTSDANGSGVREVTVPSCVEAADFVALSIALALDQERAEEVGPTDAEGAGTAGTIATTEPSAEREPLPPPEVVPAPAPATSPPSPTAPSAIPPAASTTSPPSPTASKPVSPWFIGASVDLASGLLPELSVGPSLRAGRSVGDWEIQVSTSFFRGGTYELEEAFNPVALGWLGGSAGGCRLFRSPKWIAGVCAHAELGGVTGREQQEEGNRESRGGTGFFLGIVPRLEGRAVFGKHLQGLASAGASIPLLSDPFILSDGTEVFRSRPGFRGSVGLLYFF